MATERDLYLAKAEVERRLHEAQQERLIRLSREPEPERVEEENTAPGINLFAWLRRLADRV